MTVLAVEGSFASVIGGAPAAAVVFAGEVDRRTAADPRVAGAGARGWPRPAAPSAPSSAPSWPSCGRRCRAEKLTEVATEFDGVHNIQRAVEVGSVDAVIAASELRPRLVAGIEAGL